MGKILVVDDVQEVRSLCAEIIQSIGLESATAAQPSEANCNAWDGRPPAHQIYQRAISQDRCNFDDRLQHALLL